MHNFMMDTQLTKRVRKGGERGAKTTTGVFGWAAVGGRGWAWREGGDTFSQGRKKEGGTNM